MKGVQCYELFGGIALKNHALSFFSFIKIIFLNILNLQFLFSCYDKVLRES